MKKLILAALTLASPLCCATDVELSGFIKADLKSVHGDIPYAGIWTGADTPAEQDTAKTQFSGQESRLRLALKEARLSAVIEMDFANSAQGNAVVSNSYSPRLRHAYLAYRDVLAGQTWSTLVNSASFPETTNLGGPLVGEAMVRQAQLRYQGDHWQLALENPKSYGTRTNNEGNPVSIDDDSDWLPDLILRRDWRGDWGQLSLSGLARYLDPDGLAEVGVGASASANLALGQDRLQLQLHYGQLGRYVGTSAAKDIANGQLETSVAAMLAYRHRWVDSLRSTLFIGKIVTEVERVDRTHLGITLFASPEPYLDLGLELGHLQVRDEDTDFSRPRRGGSSYLQATALYRF
ncbi:hypothetical protein FCL40_01020 [Ferrimonas sediminicola]|uniref:Porin n=1 Tax=Ferrimonas sediminicola TaxID=2569538 RepID=A0A4U1BII9_9GAMM|nr:hypothetical protein [Ferrimonas sediminicola]TKB51169.1 hypothetical protein FCL40_01020 [Ferrimonas sediminicola]